MKTYQVIEFSGQYEDYYEIVIGTFLDKEKATEFMNKEIEEQKCIGSKYERCCECERDETRLNKQCFKHFYEGNIKFEDYCCDNEAYIDDKINYKIEEFEVIK